MPAVTDVSVPRCSSTAADESARRSLGTLRECRGSDISDPDWFHDPVTGRRAPEDRFAFRIRHRSEAETGNVKQVWEPSRHHHLTLLAAAYFVTQDERYADLVGASSNRGGATNPFLSGVHWTSGIEIGLRLIVVDVDPALARTAGPACDVLFERQPVAVRQIVLAPALPGSASAASARPRTTT